MARIDYDFDNTPPPQPGRWGMRIRLALIFLVVVGITAGLIYYLRPQSEESAAPGPEAGETVGRTPDPDEFVVPAGGSSAPKESTLPGEGGNAAAAELPGEAELPEPPKEEPVGQPTVEPTETPEKGKPWAGDPAIDLADVPKSEIPVEIKPSLDADFSELERLIAEKSYAPAAALASKLLANNALIPASTEWRRAAAFLTEANLAIVAGAPSPEVVTHTAKAGDSYSRVAAKYHTTIEAIKLLNHIPESNNTLRIQQRLKIYPGPWRIRVFKGARILELYNRDKLFAVFDVGIGRLGKTPSANFVLSSKLRNPDWYTPEGRVIKYGDPDNPLGNYFLKLAPSGTPDRPLVGYGIHGTQDESSVTKSLSNGCIRMRNAEVEQLYIIVPGRTPVEIVD